MIIRGNDNLVNGMVRIFKAMKFIGLINLLFLTGCEADTNPTQRHVITICETISNAGEFLTSAESYETDNDFYDYSWSKSCKNGYSLQLDDASLISDEIMPTIHEFEMEASGRLVFMETWPRLKFRPHEHYWRRFPRVVLHDDEMWFFVSNETDFLAMPAIKSIIENFTYGTYEHDRDLTLKITNFGIFDIGSDDEILANFADVIKIIY